MKLPLANLAQQRPIHRDLASPQSKLAIIMFTAELARRVAGKQIYVNTLHPGMIPSDLQNNMTVWPLTAFIIRRLMITPEEGALTQLYLATSPEVEKDDIRGQYYVPIAKRGSWPPGRPTVTPQRNSGTFPWSISRRKWRHLRSRNPSESERNLTPCLVLSSLVLSCLVLSCLVLSCLVLFVCLFVCLFVLFSLVSCLVNFVVHLI